MSVDPIALPASTATTHITAWMAERTRSAVTAAADGVIRLKTQPPQRAHAVLAAWNEICLQLTNASSVAEVMSELHPQARVRAEAERCVAQIDRFSTELDLDPELYAVFTRADTTGLDAPAARLLAEVVRDFRRSGVDQEEADRERIAALSQALVGAEQEFARNIREDTPAIRVHPARLAGLPTDWLAEHPVEADGLVTITTNQPDAGPVYTYAHDRQVRHDLRMADLGQAWPANDAVLRRLLSLRHEFAQLLGYANWAEYDAEVMMAGSGTDVSGFIDAVAAAARDRGLRDRAALLERAQLDDPGLVTLPAADVAYYTDMVRTEQFEVDAKHVRTYFDCRRTCDGLLALTGDLFGLEYHHIGAAPTWHADVRCYDVHAADGDRIGRIYLDLHPRAGKFSHAAQFDLAPGIAGRQLPEAVLACNLPRDVMEHDDVVTLFHEFGHLLHHVLAGQGPWVQFSGVATEADFVEAPSQLFEEWAWDPAVLRRFAHDQHGRPIPEELVARMRAADDVGQGLETRTQVFYAALSHTLHTGAVADIDAHTAALQKRYSLVEHVPGTHMTAAFGHLEDYASGYYTYLWSLVIAKDLFSGFDQHNLLNATRAHRYRDAVLAPGGARAADQLVADFLGRDYSFTPFEQWLAR